MGDSQPVPVVLTQYGYRTFSLHSHNLLSDQVNGALGLANADVEEEWPGSDSFQAPPIQAARQYPAFTTKQLREVPFAEGWPETGSFIQARRFRRKWLTQLAR